MKTAREAACKALGMCMSPEVGGHGPPCEKATAAIEARDAEWDREAGDSLTLAMRTRERNAALAALKVAREALEEFERDESESIKFVAARALTRISELVPS